MKQFLTTSMIVVALGLTIATTASAAVPHKVLGGPKDQFWVAHAPGMLAHTQAPATVKGGRRTVLFLQPDGGDAVRVNPAGTFANHPSIDLGNSRLGNVMVYAQRNSVHAAGDLKVFDLDSRTISGPPSGVNTSKDEGAPTIEGDLLMFARGPKDDFFKKLILFDLSTDTSVVLDEAYYIWPGSIEGDWLTWEACDAQCSVYRYRISAEERTRVRKPKADSLPYSPLIDDAGAVYYLNSGARCGQHVKLYRATPGGRNVLYSFPAGVDGWLGDIDVGGVNPEIYFARQRCAAVNADIYRIRV